MRPTSGTGASLRPVERVIMRELEAGTSLSQIAMSLRKKPGTIRRIAAMVDLISGLDLDRNHARSTDAAGNRPIERTIRRLRADGQGAGEIASRLGRSGEYVRRVELYAQMRQAARGKADGS